MKGILSHKIFPHLRLPILLCFFIFTSAYGWAASSLDGYNLFSPITSTDTYLMDNDGNIVYTWSSSYNPALSVYLLENGKLLRTGKYSGPTTFSTAGGVGGIVQTIQEDGTVSWEYQYASDDYQLHHDVKLLPSGNILMISWERKTSTETASAGRNPSLLSDNELWPDYIIEVDPATSTIVWEWHAWDHLVQDYDSSKSNYGVVADHPELIDLNYTNPGRSGADWTHFNSIDYSETFDQILISVHSFSEIWIIDHSTTTAEAANHTGGNSGKGGDLLYRWGNPQTYGAGSDQKFYAQHDAKWIESGYSGEGNILVFNNGQGRMGGLYSSVDEFVPPVDNSGNYTLITGPAYGPSSQTWIYTASTPTDFFSSNISGAQRLSNGNTLICNGRSGIFFEVDSDKETVWTYDYSTTTFRVTRYATDYAGLPSSISETETTVYQYPIVDTNQSLCYDSSTGNTTPCSGAGYDADYSGNQPSYTVSGDGLTVTDNVTGLIWTQSTDIDGSEVVDYDDKLYQSEAISYCDGLTSGGYSDWRLPDIKEAYSLILFTGTDASAYSGSDTSVLTPFIDSSFDWAFGDTTSDSGIAARDRIIDGQYASTTSYVSTTMNNDATMFGVNYVDGRIKGYPSDKKEFYVRCVRGNTEYGLNNFTDNNDETISDLATSLMWQQNDSSSADWDDAVSTCEAATTASHTDWRLPDAKELQSIVDYSRSPDTTNSAAIDSVFNATSFTNEEGITDWGYYWASTTHADGGFTGTDNTGKSAAYLSFGRALGFFNSSIMDVHGAGSQRSDGKVALSTGNSSADVGYGTFYYKGPQGDILRLNNYVRCVRQIDQESLCTYTLSSTSATVGPSGSTGSVSVTASSTECRWTATSSDTSWLTIDTGSSGTGDRTVNYSVSENTSTIPRTGTMTIEGEIFTLTQTGTTPTNETDTMPGIKANNSDGPVTINKSGPLSIAISLDPGSNTGTPADWYIVVQTPTGEWQSLNTSQDPLDYSTPGISALIQNFGLVSFDPFQIFSTKSLSVGKYTYYFVLVISAKLYYLDSVVVNVQ